MANAETPTIAAAAHTHSTYAGLPTHTHGALQVGGQIGGLGPPPIMGYANQATGYQKLPFIIANAKQGETMSNRRLVQVFIADPDKRVPLEQSMIYSGEQRLTDLTDQELFFEVDIKNLLDAHNAKRVKIIDKSVKDRSEYLEPAKIRDLKMVVTTIAQF
jgi:hypothetical protein